MDEKAVGAGHDYFTLVTDLTRSAVEYIATGRTGESLAGFYEGLDTRQLAGIQAVAMDMWAPYVRATCDHVPGAERKIVFDRFHIMKQMNQALDKVRLGEHRRLSSWGCDLLKGTKHWWLYGQENLPDSPSRTREVGHGHPSFGSLSPRP